MTQRRQECAVGVVVRAVGDGDAAVGGEDLFERLLVLELTYVPECGLIGT